MQEIQLRPSDLCFPRSLRAILVGPSQWGKSKYMMNMVRFKDQVFARPYTKFIFCSPNLDSELTSPQDEAYKQEMIRLAEPAEMVFYNHVITEEELGEESNQGRERLLCFIDDFSDQVFSQKVTTQLFTRLSSHQQIDTVIGLHHGITSKQAGGKNSGMIWNSANVIILFRSLANQASIGFLSTKIFPYANKHLEKSLNQATRLLGNYAKIVIFANLDNDLNRNFSVRANVVGNGDLILFKNPTYYAVGLK